MYFGPGKFKCLLLQVGLKIFQQLFVGVNGARRLPRSDRLGGHRSRRFADIPFHRVQTIATIGNVGCADILAGRQQILDAFWNERT